LVEVLFENENIGYASGADSNGGIILKTSDGGLTWNAIYNSNIPGEFVWKLQILASNPNVIFGAVEANDPNLGKMIRSVDQGVSWVSKQVPYTSVQGIGFLSETHGWIGGYTSAAGTNFPFMETTDGGDTWFDAGVGGNLNKIFFLSDQLAYAAGATIYKFSDTGLSSPNFVETNRVPLNAKILPTPVTDKLNLTVQFNDADHLVIELFDSLGRRLKTFQFDTIKQAGTKNYSFDFQYPSGTYFLNLHNDTGRQSIKFTK